MVVSGAQNQLFYYSRIVPNLEGYTRGMEECLRPLAYELRRIGGPATTVLAPDIGLVGYVSGTKVYDTAGTVGPGAGKLFAELCCVEGVEGKVYRDMVRPDFIIDRFHHPERLESE